MICNIRDFLPKDRKTLVVLKAVILLYDVYGEVLIELPFVYLWGENPINIFSENQDVHMSFLEEVFNTRVDKKNIQLIKYDDGFGFLFVFLFSPQHSFFF